MSNSFTLDNVLSRIQRWAASPVVTTVQSANLPPCLHYLIWLQYSPNKHLVTNYYRPQTKFAKVMFLHLSICSQEGPASRGVCIWGCLHPGGLHPGGLHPGGVCIQADPLHWILRDKVNERAVRILLECILVWYTSTFSMLHISSAERNWSHLAYILMSGVPTISTSYIIVFVEVTNYAILSMYPHIYADSRCLIAYLEMSSSVPNNNKNINNNALVF